jgi:pimeloyl-ACP methyl ester carboxylesterase
LTAQLLDQLGHETVDVLGISWGGGLAQQFVKDFPTRCNRLVLVVTSAGVAMVPGKPSALLKLISRDHFRDSEHMTRFFRDLEGGVDGDKRMDITMPFERFERGEFRGQLYQLLASWGWTSIHWLHRIMQPTLVLSGIKDVIVPPINGKILAKRIPNASLRMIDGGHLFLMNKPKVVTGMIEAFLRGEGEFASNV